MKPGATTWPRASSSRVPVEAVADLDDAPVGHGDVGRPARRPGAVDDASRPGSRCLRPRNPPIAAGCRVLRSHAGEVGDHLVEPARRSSRSGRTAVSDGRFGGSLKPNRHGGLTSAMAPRSRPSTRAVASVRGAQESARYHSRTPDGLTP